MTFIHDDLLGGDCNLEVSAADSIICQGFEELSYWAPIRQAYKQTFSLPTIETAPTKMIPS